MSRSVLSVSLALLGMGILLSGCAINPATGQRQLSFIGEGREIQMGRHADPQIVESLGLYPDSAVQRYVRGLGEELAAVSERPGLPWTFRVLDDATVNAFALPGGFIYITRGILSHLTSEAQLVGVLGHEIGHVTARHSVNQMSRQQLTQGLLLAGMVLSSRVRSAGDYLGGGLQVLSLKFGRDDETQSDQLGIRYMGRLGYDPRELAGVMRMLERTSASQTGGGQVPEWLSTHPDPGNRVRRINEIVTASGEDLTGSTVARNPFLRRLDDMMFGANPREGFFDGSVFHHPDLRFRIDFPMGWATANGKSSVQAVPSSRDAAMSLTLGEGSPRAALDDFASLEGISVGRARTDDVNGISAAQASFSAGSGEGDELRGSVLFVSHGGTTYRVLGYSTAGRWSDYQRVVERALGSFRKETDRDVLSVQPARLSIVSVGESLSGAAFLDRFPSSVSLETLTLINQIEAGEEFPAGSLAKRVEGGR